jgi:hypothetical protein
MSQTRVKKKRNGKLICLLLVLGLVSGVSIFFYYWWDVYLPNQGLVPDKPINVLDDTPVPNNYYPRPAYPSHLYAINTTDLVGEETVTILTLMGVTAQGSAGPQVYMENNGSYYSRWLDLIREEGIAVTPISDCWDLVALFAGDLAGYIIYKADNEGVQQSHDPILSSDTLNYKHKDESYCVAVSLCGIMNAIAVDEGDVAKATAAGLTQVYDARGKDCEWLFASDQFRDELRHDMIFEVEHHTDRRLRLIDYAVFCKAAVWHAETHAQRAEFLKNFEADSPSFGWGAVGPADEAGLNLQVTAAGGFFMPSDWAWGLSVFAAIPVECKQQPLPALPDERNVHYVTIIMSDGDNLQWSMAGLEDQKFFGSPRKGEFAMGWTIPPAMADLCPIILRHYYQQASPKDRFVAGVSGHGLIYNSKHPWEALHTNRSGPLLERADLKVVTIQDFGWQKATFAATADLSGVTGVIYMDYRQYALQSGKCMWVNDKPCISFTYNYWIGYDSTGGIASSVNTASKNIHSPYAYSLVVVHAWSYGMEDIARLVSSFDSDVRVVDPETFIALYAQNVPHVDSYAISLMHFITLFGQYFLIAFGIAIAIFIIKRGVKKLRKKQSKESDPVPPGIDSSAVPTPPDPKS